MPSDEYEARALAWLDGRGFGPYESYEEGMIPSLSELLRAVAAEAVAHARREALEGAVVELRGAREESGHTAGWYDAMAVAIDHVRALSASPAPAAPAPDPRVVALVRAAVQVRRGLYLQCRSVALGTHRGDYRCERDAGHPGAHGASGISWPADDPNVRLAEEDAADHLDDALRALPPELLAAAKEGR